MESKITIELKAKKKMDSTINFGFVTFLPCLVHLSLVRITIAITMLYSKSYLYRFQTVLTTSVHLID